MNLTQLTAKELSRGYRKKDFSITEVAEAYLDAIDKNNKGLNVYLEVFDDVQEQAEASEKLFNMLGDDAHELHGIPLATKDNILIEGRKASAASKMLANHVATYDATCIARLKETHPIFLGRTNMDEFAMGTSTEHSAYGPTKNPRDPNRAPGGTSGGSAASIAANMAAVSFGTDTGGSVRQPAALCGVYGFKPTYGAISRYGLIAMGSSLDQLGINAKCASDIETVFNVVRGNDPMDATTLSNDIKSPPLNKKIGVPRDFVKDAQPAAVKEFERSLEVLASQGYEIIDIELKTAPHALAAYYIIMPAEVSTNLARFDGMRYGLNVEGDKLFDEYRKSRSEGFGAETRRRIMLGTYVLSAGYYDAYYRRATILRGALVKEFDEIFKDVSYIATPTAPGPAFKLGEKQDPLSLYLEDVFTVSANLAGVPAISVPFGSIKEDGFDLPVGTQFMSPRYSESSLFSIARDLMSEEK